MDAREIIDYIATSPKRTPVKAYVKEAAGAQVSYPQDAHVFGEGMSRIVFADWSSLAPVLEGASEDGRILDYVVESDRRNSGVPLLDLKGVSARIEPGALIREKVKIGDNAVIMMGAIQASGRLRKRSNRPKAEHLRKNRLIGGNFLKIYLEPRSGLEPETSSLPWMRSTN